MTRTSISALTSDLPYGLHGTWPRFRFAERDIGARWEVTTALDDATLARGGFRLAGQIRDAGNLTEPEQAELAALLRESGDHPLSDAQEARLSALLECCPFAENLPPIDVDPQDAVEADVLAFARRFDEAWRAAGLGTIRWLRTGGRGLHGHLTPPPGLSSPHLMRSYGTLVRKIAHAAALPLLSDHRSKEGRPPILIDDTLFDRDASGRGGLWRLEGAPHSKTGRRKVVCEELPHEEPTVTEETRQRLLQSLEHLNDLYGVTDTPRQRSGRGRLPKPITELQKRRQLENVAKLVVECCPSAGARHDYRKALAGWLLREGVPARIAAATIALAGDPADAKAVVTTTVKRLVTERNVYGYKKLSAIVGEDRARQLVAALNADLAAVGAKRLQLSDLLSPVDRETLRQAARLADEKGFVKRAKALRRAARCGIAAEEVSCQGCGKTGMKRMLMSERATCSHCAMRRSVSTINWAMTKWPTRLSIARRRLPDETLAVARTERKRWQKRLSREQRTHARWIIAPGWLVMVTADDMAGGIMRSWVAEGEWEDLGPNGLPNEQTLSGVVELLAPIVRARAQHLREHLEAVDPEGLAEDDWVDKVMETTAGRQARALMPWPKSRDLRLMAVNAARARRNEQPLPPNHRFPTPEEKLRERSACCGSRQDFRLRCCQTNEVIGIRDDRPWTFAEGSVRAELGYRGEERRFDEWGEPTIVVLPPTWDEQLVLRE